MIELTFDAFLAGTSSITTLAKGGIHPLNLPKDACLPAIHYLFVGGSSTATQDGYGSQEHRVEVSCWGRTYADAVTLRHAVIAALDQYRGANIFITFLLIRDIFEPDIEQYRAIAEFYVYSNFAA